MSDSAQEKHSCCETKNQESYNADYTYFSGGYVKKYPKVFVITSFIIFS